MKKILFIDDDKYLREAYSEILKLNGYEVTTLTEGTMAAECVSETSYDIVITDIVMPGKEGLATIMDIRNISKDIPILAISGGGRVSPKSHLFLAKKMGANDILEKPFDGTTFIQKIESLISN